MKYYKKIFTSSSETQREYTGYTFFSQYYSLVPRNFSLNLEQHSVQYEDVAIKGTLLTDILAQDTIIDLRQMFRTLAHLFQTHAVSRESEGGTRQFFMDRGERLDAAESLYETWTKKNQTISVNNHTSAVSPHLIIDVKDALKNFDHGICVPSQGDLHERNIFSDGTIIDFEGAGWNLLATDIATFIWHTLFAGNYFGPKYASWATDKDRSSPSAQLVVQPNSNVNIRLTTSRLSLLRQFMEECIGNIPLIDDSILRQSEIAIVFRLLTTFPVAAMTHDDQHIIFSLVNYFFNNEDESLLSKITLLVEVKI